MYTKTKLLTFFLILFSVPLFSQINSSDSVNAIRAGRADSLAQRYKNRNFKFDSALFYARRAVSLRRNLIDRAALAESLMGLGEVYHLRKKYKEAVAGFKESARIAHQLVQPNLEKRAYDLLIRTSKSMDNYREALYYQGLKTAINDTLLQTILEERAREIATLKNKLEEEKVQNENKVLKQQQEISSMANNEQELQQLNEKYIKMASIGILIAGVLFMILLYRNYRLKKQLQRERASQENEDQERLAISKDIREDLGHELSRINVLSQEVSYKPTSNDAKANISSITEISTRLMENTRELVWQLNTENTTLVNLIARLREYSAEYLQDLSLEIIFRNPDSLPNVQLKKTAYRNIFIAVKEALTNIVKHARALNVDISVTLKGDYLNITVKDDGVGYDRPAELLGAGVKSMKARIQSIGGLLNVVSEDQGTSVRMDIRISQILKS